MAEITTNPTSSPPGSPRVPTGTPAAGAQYGRRVWPEGKVKGGVKGLARCEWRGCGWTMTHLSTVSCTATGRNPMPKITVGQENRADPEIRDDAQRSAQPVMANRAGGTTVPSPTMAGVDPKVVNRAAGAATDPDGPTGRLATWLAATTLDDVPSRVRERAKYLLLDGVGCAMVGAQLPVSRIGVEGLTAIDPAGPAALIGWGEQTTSPQSAAMLNSSFIQGFELDDFHPEAPLHSNSLVVPAMLAAVPHLGRVSGERLLLGAILGYETGPRVGLALGGLDMLSRGWHSGVVFGPLAAAASVGSLYGLDAGPVRGRPGDGGHPVRRTDVGPVRVDGQAHAARFRLA